MRKQAGQDGFMCSSCGEKYDGNTVRSDPERFAGPTENFLELAKAARKLLKLEDGGAGVRIELPKSDGWLATGNHYELLQWPDGVWTIGVAVQFNDGGSSFGGVFSIPPYRPRETYPTRETALRAVQAEVEKWIRGRKCDAKGRLVNPKNRMVADGWRKHFEQHLQESGMELMEQRGRYQVMPAYSESKFAALVASVKAHGVHKAADVIDEPALLEALRTETDDAKLVAAIFHELLDGEHRLKAWLVNKRDVRDFPLNVIPGSSKWPEADRRAYARRINLIRRDLSPEEFDAQIRAQLKETPNASSREIARSLGISKGAVEKRRKATGHGDQLTSPSGPLSPSGRPAASSGQGANGEGERRVGKDGKVRKLPEAPTDPRIVAAARKGAEGDPGYLEVNSPVFLLNEGDDPAELLGTDAMVIGRYQLAKWPDGQWTFGYEVELKSRDDLAKRSVKLSRAPWRLDPYPSASAAVHGLSEMIAERFDYWANEAPLTDDEQDQRDSWRLTLQKELERLADGTPADTESEVYCGQCDIEGKANCPTHGTPDDETEDRRTLPIPGTDTGEGPEPPQGEGTQHARPAKAGAAQPPPKSPLGAFMTARVRKDRWPRIEALATARVEDPPEILDQAIVRGLELMEAEERRLAGEG